MVAVRVAATTAAVTAAVGAQAVPDLPGSARVARSRVVGDGAAVADAFPVVLSSPRGVSQLLVAVPTSRVATAAATVGAGREGPEGAAVKVGVVTTRPIPTLTAPVRRVLAPGPAAAATAYGASATAAKAPTAVGPAVEAWPDATVQVATTAAEVAGVSGPHEHLPVPAAGRGRPAEDAGRGPVPLAPHPKCRLL